MPPIGTETHDIDAGKRRLIRDTLQGDLRELIRPELDAQECRGGPYILLAEIDEGIELPEGVAGLTSPSLSEVYRDSIADYAGAGPAMVARYDDGLDDFVATVCHETTHRLLATHLCRPLPSQEFATQTRQFISQSTWDDFGPDANSIEEEVVAARAAHGLPFIRMAVHLASRFCAVGWPVNTHELLAWHEITNTPSPAFFDVLRDECHDLRRMPLSKIAKTRAPSEFDELFEPAELFRPLT